MKGSDNSGCVWAKVVHVSSTFSFYKAGALIVTVLKKFDIRRKLKAKRRYYTIPVTITPVIRRIRGEVMAFKITRIVFLVDSFRKLLGTRIYGPSMREVRYLSIERAIVLKIRSYCAYLL